MSDALFSIRCTTCQRSLRVRSAAAIGQILACPKCGSMVQVTPPADWSEIPVAAAAGSTAMAADSSAPSAEAPKSPHESTTDTEAPVETAADEQPPKIPPWMSPTEAMFRKWTLLVGIPTASVLVVWVAVSLLFSGGEREPAPTNENTQLADGPKIENPPTVSDDAVREPWPPLVDEEPTEATAVDTDRPDQLDVPDEEPASSESAGEEDTPDAQPVAPVVSPERDIVTEVATLDTEDTVPAPEVVTSDAGDGPADNPPVSLSPTIDAEARLAERLLAIDQQNTSLADLIDLLSVLSSVPITFDLDEMTELGVHPDDKVSVKMTDASIREVLQATLEPLGLRWVVENHQLLVTSSRRESATVREVVYPVADLTGGQQSGAEELADLIRRFARPATFTGDASLGRIEIDNDSLRITHGEAAHAEMLAFLEKLRVARGKPLRGGRDPSEYSLSTRYSQAGEALQQTFTANFRRPRPLADIVDHFQDATAVNISINWLALRREGISPEAEASVVVADETLSEALAKLLDPLGLTYRVVASRWLFVTSRREAAEKPALEFYPVGALLKNDPRAVGLLDEIRRDVAPATWRTAGGKGDAHYDAESGYLLVLQSDPAHLELVEFLDSRQGDTP